MAMDTITDMDTASRVPMRHSEGSPSDGPGSEARASGWPLRQITIAVFGVVLLAVTVQVSVAGVFGKSEPLIALKLAPFDALARANLAERIVTAEDEDQYAIARSLAVDALRRDLTQTSAIRALALLEGMERDGNSSALSMMSDARRLAKREATTQMWFAERARLEGNREAFVHHLDIALRTMSSSRSSIFPLLDAAAADPQVATMLLRTLEKRPNWASEYSLFAVRNGANLTFAQRVARQLLDPAKPTNRGQYFMLLQRLADVALLDEAWSIYSDPTLALTSSSKKPLRNEGFEQSEDTSRFDWSYAEDSDLWARKETVEGQGLVLRVGASGGRSGEVARQIVRLPKGQHRLSSRFGDLTDNTSGLQIWLDCTGAGGERPALLRVGPLPGGGEVQRAEATFTVPDSCTFQLLTIRIAGDGPQVDTGPWVDELAIRPTN